MPKIVEKLLPEFFIILVLMLVAIGVLMTYSSSVFYAEKYFKNEYYFFYRELVWVVMGVTAAIIARSIHYQVIQRLSSWILLGAILLLILVFVPGIGHRANNASRWIRFAGFTFQPSEFAKFAIILFTADNLAKHRRHVAKFFRGVFIPLLVVMVPIGLIVIEPDLGMPVVIITTVFVMFFVAGTRITYLLLMVIAAIPALVVLIMRNPYRIRRLMTFINPDSDPLGAGFHINQSLIAVGSGQFKGVGLGESVQKMHYLPEAHTDFVFAIIGEELGFIGAGTIVVLFMLLIFVIYKMTRHIKDMFGHLVAVGIMTIIGLQAVINIGVVIGCMPTKGLALPFISYGGSSLIMTLAACGLLVNIVQNQNNIKRDITRTNTVDFTIV
jgi:cell division protein FtsW